MVPCVQVVTRAQTVVGVKVHFLVDARVTEQVEQHLLGDASGAEVLHLCRGSKVRDTGVESTSRITSNKFDPGDMKPSELRFNEETLQVTGMKYVILHIYRFNLFMISVLYVNEQ